MRRALLLLAPAILLSACNKGVEMKNASVEDVAEATKDARARADQVSTQGGRGIRGLRSAKMGVFQITPLYSSETSWEGRSDTTSREKTM